MLAPRDKGRGGQARGHYASEAGGTVKRDSEAKSWARESREGEAVGGTMALHSSALARCTARVDSAGATSILASGTGLDQGSQGWEFFQRIK